MPERKVQSNRFTYVFIHVHWEQKPGSHVCKVRTESASLPKDKIDGNSSVQPNIFSLVSFYSFIFQTLSHYVVLPVLELTFQTRLALNSDPAAFASSVLGLNVCATTVWHVQSTHSSYQMSSCQGFSPIVQAIYLLTSISLV